MNFGFIMLSSMNIGDEIQPLAALRFLPRVDYLIHREKTDQFMFSDGGKCVRAPFILLMNGSASSIRL